MTMNFNWISNWSILLDAIAKITARSTTEKCVFKVGKRKTKLKIQKSWTNSRPNNDCTSKSKFDEGLRHGLKI